MPTTNVQQLKGPGVPEKPEEFGPALGHVLRINEEGQDVVLGQAWLAGANKLVTCGHVVDQYASRPEELWVHFPASGNRYEVRGVRLHPSFVRQPDQLVKYDAAVLFVTLSYPERNANPLPIAYERNLSAQQALSAVRYPVHLGQFTSAPNPLAQLGRLLGPLRKHDSFHLLHDLALAPGDSGAPIFDGTSVVAIHCGDTATLPGLNLPTTSIRLALWVDALRDLGIGETYVGPQTGRLQSAAPAVIAFCLSFMLVFAGVSFYLVSPHLKEWTVKQPKILPVNITFDKIPDQYTNGEQVSIDLLPRSDTYLWLFYIDDSKNVLTLFPPYGYSALLKANQHTGITHVGANQLLASPTKGKLRMVCLNIPDSPLKNTDYADKDPGESYLKLDPDGLSKSLAEIMKKDPNAFDIEIDAPTCQPDKAPGRETSTPGHSNGANAPEQTSK